MPENSNEIHADGFRSPEATRTRIAELEGEHTSLDGEWARIQNDVMATYKRLIEAMATPFHEATPAEVETINAALHRLHARQVEIVDRQQRIEEELVEYLR
jgi:hypothetical protein